MRVLSRAARAMIRAPLRATLLVGVLGVSVGLALIMITVNGAFGERLDDIRSQVGTTITVRPAGTFGGGFVFRSIGGGPGGGGTVDGEAAPDDSQQQTLTDEELSAIDGMEHVTGYSRKITAQYDGDSLVSAIEPPEGIELPEGVEAFTPPVSVTGTEDANSLTAFGEEAEIVEGRTFNADEREANVAVMGQQLAEKNGLSVGDTVDLDGTSIEIIGLFSTGTQFGDNSVTLPLDTARTIFDRGTEVDEVAVYADKSSNVGKVADAIRETLGEDKADVTSDEAQYASIAAPVTDAKDSSRIAMIAALVASAAIILFSIGIVARQRVKEIGILKAVGASNWNVVTQLGIETVFVSVTAAIIGAFATFPLAQSVANGLVSDTATTTGPQLIGGPGGDVVGGFAGGPGGGGPGAFAIDSTGAGGLLGDVDVAVSPLIFGYALGIAIVLALIATIIPAWYVGRVRPAEVLRYE